MNEIRQRNAPDFGQQFLLRFGSQSFGFADYYHSPSAGVPDQRFTVAFVGPAGSCRMPAPAAVCLAVILAVPVLLICAGFWMRRR
jgi:hypothetical protein